MVKDLINEGYEEFRKELQSEIIKDMDEAKQNSIDNNKLELDELKRCINRSSTRIGILEFLSNDILSIRDSWDTLPENTRTSLKELVDILDSDTDLYGIMDGTVELNEDDFVEQVKGA